METFKRWFRFSPREQRGIWVFFLLAIAVWGSPYVLPYLLPKPVTLQAPTDSAWQANVASGQRVNEPSNRYPRHSDGYRKPAKVIDAPVATPRLRPFDPNTADSATWLSLGVSPRVAGRIIRYRNAGGRFRSPDDLRKIWGLPPETAEQLMPWVKLPEASTPTSQFPNPHSTPSGSPTLNLPTQAKPKQRFVQLDINQADSSQWEALPGIGPALARRVVQYREKLGGFVRIEQVGELYGLADSVFQRIKPQLMLTSGAVPFRKLPINRVSQNELQAHPYIRFALAKQLLAYRQQHGSFRQATDLRALQGVDPSSWERILPYLDFSE
jgi:competence ComEA-like helix-hairpin-helix protein